MNDNKNAKLVFTLDGTGIVYYGIQEKLDRILSNFLTTDGGQSSLYHDTYKSFQKINADNVNDVELIRENTKLYLVKILKDYFDNVDVEVYLSSVNNSNRAKAEDIANTGVALNVKIYINDNGDSLNIQKPIFYKNGVYQHTISVFNSETM